MQIEKQTYRLYIDNGDGYKLKWESEPFEVVKYNLFERIINAIKSHYS